MGKSIIKIYRQYRQMILYLFFGVCTTVINTAAYGVLYKVLNLGNIPSTMSAWLLAVIFAFITNKICVFQSKSEKLTDTVRELVSFFSCRLLTGILDVAVMVIAVDYLHGNSLFWKLFSNIFVTVINYAASRVIIF